MSNLVVAIFVGGRGTRMGGADKGLLPSPETGEPLVERMVRIAKDAWGEPILVGDATAYGELALGVPRVADDPPGIGPLGGLGAALQYARELAGMRYVISVACDMPHVDRGALERLRDHPSSRAVVAPRRGPDAPFEPLLARYDADAVPAALATFLARGGRSFQKLFAELDVEALDVDDALRRALVDWDTPEDVARDGGSRSK